MLAAKTANFGAGTSRIGGSVAEGQAQSSFKTAATDLWEMESGAIHCAQSETTVALTLVFPTKPYSDHLPLVAQLMGQSCNLRTWGKIQIVISGDENNMPVSKEGRVDQVQDSRHRAQTKTIGASSSRMAESFK